MRLRRLAAFLVLGAPLAARAGPETSMRELASSQIKKGVRALGMGGDGATLGNYALVWKDAGGAVADYGQTSFGDTGNLLQFTAVGFSTPKLFDRMSVFVVAMSEWGTGLKLRLKTPAFASGAQFLGDAGDDAVFVKMAMPLGGGVSVGALVGYERSSLSAVAAGGRGSVEYTTSYRPSGGLGVAWEPIGDRLLVGARVLASRDGETRTDPLGAATGFLASWEVRGGAAVRLWRGALVDAGWAGLAKRSTLDGTRSFDQHLVAGAEQAVLDGALALRAGWNETSPTAGVSIRAGPLKLDAAYVRNLGVDRTRGVFGERADSVMATLTYDYERGR